MSRQSLVINFDKIGSGDITLVGGKNANLGEMINQLTSSKVAVPPGFATTAALYREFVEQNHLALLIDQHINALHGGQETLLEAGEAIRAGFIQGEFNQQQTRDICKAYAALCDQVAEPDCSVAVRSSATAEDLPQASFAGQQESYLNICGQLNLLEACRYCFASVFTDRAIAYREEQGFDHRDVALSVGVQQMVRSDKACAGVMFTLDTESGFPKAVTISAAWGLGETIVKGSINPDRYMVYKPLLDNTALTPIIEKALGSKLSKMIYATQEQDSVDQLNASTEVIDTTVRERATLVLHDDEVLTLARWAVLIEQHYGRAMDIEWAKDGRSGQLYIVQARPETIESQKDRNELKRYTLKETSSVLIEGASVGNAIASGDVYCLSDPRQREAFPVGAVLVTQRTDPDWVPVMRRAAGIVTDTGGPTSHAAIVSRELKVPAIVGTGNASQKLKQGNPVTINCSEGAVGKVHKGKLKFDSQVVHIDDVPETKTNVMINVALPDAALNWWQLPVAGIGLTRIEFIISSLIRVHPMALLHPDQVTDSAILQEIEHLTKGYEHKSDYFSDVLARSVAKIAASVYPKPVVVRMSDFKSNEYRGLLGGEFFEIDEANPMLGLRGASRYYHPLYRDAFVLECCAIRHCREVMGFDNVIVMIPFCRTPGEADKVLKVMAEAGLKRGENALQVYVMCEIPSNVILAEQFAQRFDGFSIGSNDLTQLVLGIDRDSSMLKALFDARDEAVTRMIANVIRTAHQCCCKVGICGQAPSDYPEYAEFLVQCGIDSISLNPDSVVAATRHIKTAEDKLH